MRINIKHRMKNPVFWAQILLAFFTPVLAYKGITMQDVTTWTALGELVVSALSNPYVVCLIVVSVWNAVNDPTTPGLSDSDLALSYGDENHGEFSFMGPGEDDE